MPRISSFLFILRCDDNLTTSNCHNHKSINPLERAVIMFYATAPHVSDNITSDIILYEQNVTSGSSSQPEDVSNVESGCSNNPSCVKRPRSSCNVIRHYSLLSLGLQPRR